MYAVLSLYRPRLENVLAARGDGFVSIVPESERDAPSREGHHVLGIDRWDDAAALDALARSLADLGVTGIATVDEPCVRPAASLRERLGLPGTDLRTAVACTDKQEMKERLAAAGVRVARHRPVCDAAGIHAALDDLGGDIVVKPRSGFGTLATHRVSGHHELDELLRAGAFDPPPGLPAYFGATDISRGLGDAPFLAEQYIDVESEYHCELLLHQGEEIYCLPGRYAKPLLCLDATGSALLDPASVEASRIRALTREAAEVLGVVHGFVHCEVLRDRTGVLRVGELAARPGGLVIPRMLDIAHGISVFDLQADQLAGRRPQVHGEGNGHRAVAWRALPARAGRTEPQDVDLRALPGVVDVEMVAASSRPGGQVPGTMYHAGYVFCTGRDTAQALSRAEHVQDVWERAADPATARRSSRRP